MRKTESTREYPREVMILIQELINLKFSLNEQKALIGSKLLEQWDRERPSTRLKEKLLEQWDRQWPSARLKEKNDE